MSEHVLHCRDLLLSLVFMMMLYSVNADLGVWVGSVAYSRLDFRYVLYSQPDWSCIFL